MKKNLIDQTAALSYSLGTSIVHFAMAVTIKFIKPLDINHSSLAGMDSAKDVDQACLLEAAEWDFLIQFSFYVHIVLCLTNIYREIFSA